MFSVCCLARSNLWPCFFFNDCSPQSSKCPTRPWASCLVCDRHFGIDLDSRELFCFRSWVSSRALFSDFSWLCCSAPTWLKLAPLTVPTKLLGPGLFCHVLWANSLEYITVCVFPSPKCITVPWIQRSRLLMLAMGQALDKVLASPQDYTITTLPFFVGLCGQACHCQ